MADVNVTVNPQPLLGLLQQARALATQLQGALAAAQSLRGGGGGGGGVGGGGSPRGTGMSGGPINPRIQQNPVANSVYIEAMRAIGKQPGKPSGVAGHVGAQVHAKLIGPAIAIWMGTEQARRILRGVLGWQRGEETLDTVVRRLIVMSVPELFREMSSLIKAMYMEDIRRETNLMKQQIEGEAFRRDFEARMRDDPRLRAVMANRIAATHHDNRERKTIASFAEEWRGQ